MYQAIYKTNDSIRTTIIVIIIIVISLLIILIIIISFITQTVLKKSQIKGTGSCQVDRDGGSVSVSDKLTKEVRFKPMLKDDMQ